MTISEFNKLDFDKRTEIMVFFANNLTTQRVDSVKGIRYMLYQYRNLFLEVSDDNNTNKYIDCKAITKERAEELYKYAILDN